MKFEVYWKTENHDSWNRSANIPTYEGSSPEDVAHIVCNSGSIFNAFSKGAYLKLLPVEDEFIFKVDPPNSNWGITKV